MSEYQYYEFRAIDRPLDEEEMEELSKLSSRAEITPTSFTNTYNYGDFRGSPEALMDRYFDAFVYVANWGTHRLMFRIPRRFLDVETASAYCLEESLELTAKEEHVVLEFSSNEEGGGEWTEGEPWMPSLIAIRAELMRGDLRALYLAWLSGIGMWSPEEDDPENNVLEPPVPPGLAKLSAPLRALAEFLRIDDNLIEAAAAESSGEAPAEPSQAELAKWVKRLPAADKDASLLRFLTEEGDLLLRAELWKRFREATVSSGAPAAAGAERRTVAQLLEAAADLEAEKKSKAAAQAAQERARLERLKAEARAKFLDDLAGREAAAWSEVEELIATKRPKEYDRAVTLLVDLYDLAVRSNRTEEAQARIQELRRRHSSKSSLIARFNKYSLGK